MDSRQLRQFALSLPGAEEYDHGGRPSFRVRGRPRFAAGLDEDGINVMPSEMAIREAVAEWPDACAEDYHGRRLVSVRVAYRALPDEVVTELVTDAWTYRAPARLVKPFRSEPT